MGDLTPKGGHAWGKTRVGTHPTLRPAGPPSNGLDATAKSPRARLSLRKPWCSISHCSSERRCNLARREQVAADGDFAAGH
jgi:hypothetical protein